MAVTDDAMVLERMEGKKVRLVEGSYREYQDHDAGGLWIAEAFV